MENSKKGGKLVSDSLSLSLVRVISLLIGVISTSILSHGLDLATYGIYSQGNLLISMLTSLSILGFADGVNYFFNKFDSEEQKKRYINTLFGMQFLIGIVMAACVLVFQNAICLYFGSDGIKAYLIYLCFRPMLSNYTAMLQNIYISVGKAKEIALRTTIVAIVKLVAICLCVFWTKDIGTIFLLLVLMDIINVAYFIIAFSRKEFRIRLCSIDKTILKEILSFCIPVAVFVLTNSLCREMDKWVVARMGNTEELAVYTNASLPLPLEIVSAALFTVIIPVLTRAYHRGKLQEATKLVSRYLKIGYMTTAVFGVACLLLSKELISFLYGAPYLTGLVVFRLYLIVDIIKFANVSVLLSMAGKTKALMYWAGLMLAVNTVLNIVGYWLLGIIGPAVATAMVSVLNTVYLLWRGANILQCKSKNFFDWKHLAVFAAEVLVCGLLTEMLRQLLVGFGMAAFWVIVLCGAPFCGVMLLLNWKEIRQSFSRINYLEEEG